MTQRRLSDSEKIEAVKKFESGEYSYTSLAKVYGITTGAMWALLKRKKANIPISGYFCKSKRKYTLDENYFNIIDTEEKAYFLGLLYADGCNYEYLSCVTLNLQEDDVEILRRFNTCINSNRPLLLVEQSKKNDKWQNLYRLSLNDKNISKKLAELGVISNKTFTLKFPTEEQVPKHLLRHFIRGYFDGDGSISYWVEKKAQVLRFDSSLVSTEEFCIKIALFLKDELNINTKIKTRFKERNNSTRSINICTKPSIHKFMTWLYEDSTIFLQRKYNKYKELKEFEKQWQNSREERRKRN